MPATQCLQSLMNGERCQAPAVNGTLFCRHHDPQKEIEYERKLKQRQTEPFQLPDFDDKRGLFVAIKSVLHAFSDRKIKRSEAETYLYGLKMADKVMTALDEAAHSPLADLFDAITQSPEADDPEYMDDEPETRYPVRTPVPLHAQPRATPPIPHSHGEQHETERRPSDQVLARLAASRGLTYIPGEGAPERLFHQLRAQDAARDAAKAAEQPQARN